MKRVLIIRHAYGLGGAENYALNLALALRANGYEPLISTNVPELIEKIESESVKRVASLWYSRQGWGKAYYLLLPLMVCWYILLLLMHRIDIVHPQGTDDFVFATVAARILRKRVVWTDHGDLKDVMKPSNSSLLRRQILVNAKYASSVIAVSNSEKKQILLQSPGFPNIKVVHNGVTKPTDIPPVNKPQGKVIIGSTSRLLYSKGIAELIEAFARLEDDSVELWLVGKGGDEKALMKLAGDLGVKAKVRFLGYQSNVWGYLDAMDIFVHPSHYEAFCLSILEAGMLGKPVIATNVGGNPEIISNTTGQLVPVNDPEELVAALRMFLDKKEERDKRGEALKAIVSRSYNFDTIVKGKVISLYEV